MNYFMGELSVTASAEKNRDNAEFQFNIAQKLQRFGNTRIGKVFVKDANQITKVTPLGKTKFTHGIANSGKTLRKTPFAVAGLGLAGYGVYRANKTYNRYKPVIKVGRKLNSMYNDFLNRTGN